MPQVTVELNIDDSKVENTTLSQLVVEALRDVASKLQELENKGASLYQDHLRQDNIILTRNNSASGNQEKRFGTASVVQSS